jgi:uncharacterized surface protein with fasciclin (FAS1) repeats
MTMRALALGAAAAMLAVSACSNDNGGNGSAAQSPQAQKAAGGKTIAAGMAAAGGFMTAAKAAGLDQTLAGPGPYTVLAPTDQAFAAAPAGSFDAKPENRARITATLTNLILPGTVLAADIAKAVEAGKGKAPLATMGGGTITATVQDGKTVLTDAAGNKATISQADQQFSNGVVHQIDAVLLPAAQSAPAASPQP